MEEELIKISELEPVDTLYDGCCMPLVQYGETKKIEYGTLKNLLNDDLDFVKNTDEIEERMTILENAEHAQDESIEDIKAGFRDKQNKLHAGTNIVIDSNDTIHASGTLAPVAWGNIAGAVTDQEDLNDILNEKGTYSLPQSGIPKSDLSYAVQTSLGLADSALQSHQDISGKFDKTGVKTEKTTSDDDVYSCNYINGLITSGSNANGDWVKFPDGTMICSGTINIGSVNATQIVGNVYRAGIGSINYSQTFTSISSCQLTLGYNAQTSGVWLGRGDNPQLSNTGGAWIYSYNSKELKNVYVSYMAIGRWK